MGKTWTIQQAQELINKFPGTFKRPTNEALEPLEKGHKAKLSFSFASDAPEFPSEEQLWVEILLVDRDKLLGQLEDDPKYIQDLKRGEIIEFEERHIIDTD